MQQYERGAQSQPLGRLESSVMDILWTNGESSVDDVCKMLGRQWTYNTVLSTLDHLYHKGLLARCKIGRAFVYSPAMTREEWHRKRARDFVASFPSRDCLLSCLVDAISDYDEALLDDLDEEIRVKRFCAPARCVTLPALRKRRAS